MVAMVPPDKKMMENASGAARVDDLTLPSYRLPQGQCKSRLADGGQGLPCRLSRKAVGAAEEREAQPSQMPLNSRTF